MKLNVGDRVLVISYDWTGTISEIDDEDAPEIVVVGVDMDKPEDFAIKKLQLTKAEWVKSCKENGRSSVTLYTNSEDIKKLSGGSHEPEWKDIWDSGAI